MDAKSYRGHCIATHRADDALCFAMSVRARFRLMQRIILCGLLPTLAPIAAWCMPRNAPSRPLGGESPTVGIKLHAPSLITSRVSALEVNPGGLGSLHGWEFYYQHAAFPAGGRVQGNGDALFVGIPLHLIGKFGLAAGAQWLRPSSSIGYSDSLKLSLGLGWQANGSLSLGASVHTFVGDRASELSGLAAFDIGMVWRINEFLATGLVLHDLNTPDLSGLPLQRRYDLEIALRPFATRRFEIGLGLAVGERRRDFDPHLRLEFDIAGGLRFLGYLEVLRRDFHRNDDPLTDIRGSVGFSFSYGRLSYAASTVLGRSLPAGPGVLGESSAARSSYQGLRFSFGVQEVAKNSALFSHKMAFISLNGPMNERRLIQTIEHFRTLEARREVVGLVLELDGLEIGWAKCQEVRSWIQRLRRRGKKVFSYLRSPTTKELYIAAAAQRIFLDPDGTVEMRGIASRSVHLKRGLDRAGIRADFVKIAEYKAAPEALTRTQPSQPAQEVRTAIINDFFAQLISGLARGRALSSARVRALIDRGLFSPRSALKVGLVDEILDRTMLETKITSLSQARLVPIGRIRFTPDRWPGRPELAVIVIDGDIVRGKSTTIPLLDRHVVGDHTIVQTLERTSRDSRVRAIILRINSPGGSAVASAHIWRAVKRARKLKPIIVSMSDFAASGGYYAAAAGTRIFAHPATLTGSIGIFAGKADLSGLLEKLGIDSAGLARGSKSAMRTVFRPYRSDERRALLRLMTEHYESFLSAVGEGRSLSRAAVHAVARGRVWTGSQALRNGPLVDVLGGLGEAIEEARRRAKISRGQLLNLKVYPEEPKSLLQQAIAFVDPSRAQRTGTHSVSAEATRPLQHLRANAPLLETMIQHLVQILPPVLWISQPTMPLARISDSGLIFER